MGSTQELIQTLIDKRLQAVDEHRALVEEVEARGDGWSAEDDAKAEKLNADISGYKERADALMDMSQMNAESEEQRRRFEDMIRPPGEIDEDEQHADERFRRFLHAGLPGFEDEHAPKRIDVRITPEVKAVVMEAHRKGASVMDREYHDLVKGTTTAGGYTVPTSFAARLYEHLVERAAVRRTRAEVLTTGSGETLLVPKTTSHGTDASIVTEGSAIGEADPAFGQVSMGAFKYGKLVQVSSELATDTAIDLLGYVARAAGLSLGQGSGAHFVTGTGTAGGGGTQPEGVMTNITAGKVMPTGNTAGFTTAGTAADSLFDVVHSIVSGYRGRAEWLMNDATLAAARKIRDTTNQYLWQPGLTAGVPDTLLNYPVITDPTVATFSANAKVAAFGDFSLYYLIRDVDSVRFERSDEFAFANDLITFRAIIRTDGRVIDTTACKSLVASAT